MIKCFAKFSCINCVKVVQVYSSLLQKPVDNFIAQLCENENLCLESLAEFLRENRIKLYFATKFSVLSEKKTKLLAVPLKIFTRRIQKVPPKSTLKMNASQLSSKNVV